MQAAALAAHRFGLGEASLRTVGSDPQGWVQAQWQQPAVFDSTGLTGSAQAFKVTRDVLRRAQLLQGNQDAGRKQSESAMDPTQDRPAVTAPMRELRRLNLEGLQRRWQHAITSDTPVVERWVMFWSNHFTVAATKASMAGMVWPHETEAIRPHALGRFRDLLRASTVHPAMLLYLDNAQSIGPDSRAGRRRDKGLNENLARELLELHTLGVNGGYTQADVTETAKLLTGWTIRPEQDGAASFVAAVHQPGTKRVMGRSYPEGERALDMLLDDLSRHPACARHLATKLARHFVTDTPPAALVDAVAARFMATDGDLRETARALFSHPLAWQPDHPAKFKRPEEVVLSAHRMLKLPIALDGGKGRGQGSSLEQAVQAVQSMGQAMGRAPSPQGWPDRTGDWLSPDALLKRVQWAERFGQLVGDKADARLLATLSLGSDLQNSTRLEVERADSGAQALALWFASPDFQRR